MEDKAERFGVSMPGRIVAAADSVADKSFGGNRSAYLQSLVEADLHIRGAYPADPRADLHRMLDEALDRSSASVAEIRARLEELVGAPGAEVGKEMQ
jgi:hypothetical protein